MTWGCLENSDLRPRKLSTHLMKTVAWCLFSLQFLTTGVPTLLSSAVSCLSISIAGLATRTGNSQTVDLESMIAWWNVSVFEIYFFVLNKSNIKYMDWVVLVVWRRLFGRPCNFLKKRENERNRERKGSEYITHVVLNSLILVEIEMLGHLHRRSSFQIIIV